MKKSLTILIILALTLLFENSFLKANNTKTCICNFNTLIPSTKYKGKYTPTAIQIWNVTWSGSNNDYGEGVFVYGDYIYVVGYTNSSGAGGYDICLLKYDLNGNKIWNTTWGGNDNDCGWDIFVYGDYIYVVGYTDSFGAGEWDICLLKYDLNGNKIWNTTWGGSNYDTGYSVFVYGDYIYVVGYTYSFGAGNADVCLLKYDLNGNKIWNTTWGGSGGDFGYGVFVYNDYIYAVGLTSSFGAGGVDACLLKYDLDGNKIWNTTWGGNDADHGYGVFVYNDYIYIAGDTSSFGAGGYDISLLKYDSDDDGDGLSNHEEEVIGSDPLHTDTDNDGLDDYEEAVVYTTNPACNDSDGDGLSDYEEILVYFTNATNADSDSDGLSDGDEVSYDSNPLLNDTDSDGLGDYEEVVTYGTNASNSDTDGDGLSDGAEVNIYDTNPTDDDTDDDGMLDGWEAQYGLDPLLDDSSGDLDGDGLTNLGEYHYNTDPTDNDTDDDGMADGWEMIYYFDPNNSSDADSDADADGLSNLQEFQLGTDPRNSDSDEDGWSDGDEIQAGTDPLDSNSYPSTSTTSTTSSTTVISSISTGGIDILGDKIVFVLVVFVIVIVALAIVLTMSGAKRRERIKALKSLAERRYKV